MADYQLLEVISPEKLSRCVEQLAKRINRDYKGKDLVLIGILKGAFIFMADLARRLDLPVKMDFVRLASYGDKTQTSGNVMITKDVELPLQGSHVLVVEDIVDSGITLKWLLNHLRDLRPESLKVCALLDKLERREVEVPINYVGMKAPGVFLVGYGLDFSENHRNLPAIYEVVFDKTVFGQDSCAEGPPPPSQRG